MTKQATKPEAAAKPAASRPRAAFAAASFGNLRAAAGEGRGEALRILLVDIDEDPGQPRTVFDDDALRSMAESIRAHGVVQPVVVRPPVDGRYMLAFGARRVRASRLAGVADIPAVVRSAQPGDFAAQLVENQQRRDLSNSDLAAAIARLAGEGTTNKEIAAICSLKDYQVAAFRQAGNFPPELAARIDNADMRALYDLFRQWGKTPARVIAALPGADTYITVTEARRIVGDITGKPTGSVVLDRAAAAAPVPADAGATQSSGAQDPQQARAATGGAKGERLSQVVSPVADVASVSTHSVHPRAGRNASGSAPAAVVAKAADGPIFIVAAADGRTGRLVIDRRGGRPGSALVACATGIEDIDASELRVVRIE